MSLRSSIVVFDLVSSSARNENNIRTAHMAENGAKSRSPSFKPYNHTVQNGHESAAARHAPLGTTLGHLGRSERLSRRGVMHLGNRMVSLLSSCGHARELVLSTRACHDHRGGPSDTSHRP